jgi:hypothetical protein
MMWLVQVFMIAMVGVSTLLFGKQFINGLASINLNGNSMDDIEGVVSQRMKQGTGLATGIVAGAAGGVIAGGGLSAITKGAAMGGVSGGRGARPGTAAMMGLAAGKFHGAQGAQKKAQKQERKKHEQKMDSDPVYADNYQIEKDYDSYQAELLEDRAIMDVTTEEEAKKWLQWQQNSSTDPKTRRKVPKPLNPKMEELFRSLGIVMREHQDEVFKSLEEYKEAIESRRRAAATAGETLVEETLTGTSNTGGNVATDDGVFNTTPQTGGTPARPSAGPGTPVTVPMTSDADADRMAAEALHRYAGKAPAGQPAPKSTDSAVIGATVGLATANAATAAKEAHIAASAAEDLTAEVKKDVRNRPSRPTRPAPSNPQVRPPGQNPDVEY